MYFTSRALCISVPLRYHGNIKLPIAIANIGEKSNTHRVSNTLIHG